MEFVKILFWIAFAIVFYTYIGYGLLLYVLVKIKRVFTSKSRISEHNSYEPEVTLLIAAYNEKDYVHQKMENSLSLNYPKEKLKIVWITDGSNDGTDELIKRYPEAILLHEPERNGKIGAMNRGMKLVSSPLVVFSDANSMLDANSIKRMVSLFNDPQVGCVSGEKRIIKNNLDKASGSGEGLYWRYESSLKKLDAELYSVVGAAGELFAIRTELYQEVEKDTLLDDFIISLRIVQKGYTIQYDPDAFAIESASLNVSEELKRKIRIAAGGIQSIVRLAPLLNIFKFGILSFQYISHRVLRWTITPVCLFLLLPLNLYLVSLEVPGDLSIYSLLFAGQVLFYLAAITGWIAANRAIKLKLLFVPYYFLMMNYAVIMGINRFLQKTQSVNWERAKRATA